MHSIGMSFFVLFLWVSIVTTNSLSRPVYGTERYHRGSPSRSGMQTQHILRTPVYESGYLTNNGYYYYPHHEYHAYGMPTYRGEYKPKAYYYSSGPSYSYYGDREAVSNPLDDLHEEILQEDEQERETDMLGGADYGDYYIEPSESLHDTYTNNFVRNMIDYNRQKEQLAQMQEYHQPQMEDFEGDYEEEPESPTVRDEYFSDFDINPEEYVYQPKGEENFDLQKYWNELASSNEAASNSAHHQHEKSNTGRHDEDVEELKSLTKSNLKDNSENFNGRKHHLNAEPNIYAHWDQPQAQAQSSSSSGFPTLTHQNDHDEDYGLDYDDDSWINWDRKRSASPVKMRFPNVKKLVTELKIKKRLLENNSNSKTSKLSDQSSANQIKVEGQKEKYVADEMPEKFQEPMIKQSSKSHNRRLKQSIYDTIKQIINNDLELKKTGSKKRKRFVTDEENLVTQLDSLRRLSN